MIVGNYWKMQMMFNNTILSLYTPFEHFDMKDDMSFHNTKKIMDVGEKICQTKKIVICSMVRDVGRRITDIKKKVERCGEMFLDYRVLIVENDSKDDTRERLLEWSKNNNRVSILGCGKNVERCSMNLKKTEGHNVTRGRIQKMVTLRNVYLDEIKKDPTYKDFDYCFMWDLDLIGTVYLDGIAHSIYLLNLPTYQDVECMCSYGIYKLNSVYVYYDTYAHLDVGEKFHLKNQRLDNIRKRYDIKYSLGDTPKRCDSCFSGFAIYRMKNLLKDEVRYDMTPTNNDNEDDVECEHTRLCKHFKNVYINPNMIHVIMLND
jgi:hypothetical protein